MGGWGGDTDPPGEGNGCLAAAVVEEADECLAEVLVARGVHEWIKAGFGHGHPLQVLHRSGQPERGGGGRIGGGQCHDEWRPADDEQEEGGDIGTQQGAIVG